MTEENSGTNTHVCPWWFAYTFDNPLRRLVHNPERILGQWVKPGMSVLDVGCGMGHFSIGMARMVGQGGQVYSVDLQQEMLNRVMGRADKFGLEARITPRLARGMDWGEIPPLDFALCFWMVHEVPDQGEFLAKIAGLLQPGGRLLIAEPKFHVSGEDLEKSVDTAARAGLKADGRPLVRFSHTAILKKAG